MSQPDLASSNESARVKSNEQADARRNASDADFPIVGIGCSAGGLNALEKFLSHVPEDTRMAFVVVQHLAPDYPSALPELLRHATKLPVHEVEDAVVVTPGSVFVIPPNKDLSLLHGKLHLLERMERQGLRLPIDFFLRSLAEDRKDKAIGVILSGMGSDGVFGLRAIKEMAGLTLVQQPASAEAESMPHCAIEAGVADIVAVPEELPGKISEYLRHPSYQRTFEPPATTAVVSALDKIAILLRDHSGNDFSLYKTNTLYRRIERRMAVHQIATIDDYVTFLRGNQHELDLLFQELLIGVTNFFRDPEVWDYLRTEAIPRLLAQHPAGKAFRAWVSACSTGEEAYSLAIVFREAIEALQPAARYTLQIYATDLDPNAIEQARKGYFPDNIAADIAPERLARHFVAEEGGGYRIGKEIREMLVFAPQNIISDPPFTKIDILTCRNLLIYFDAPLQKKLLPLFFYSLNPGGLLLLGSAETVGNYGNLFAALNNKLRIYRRFDLNLPVAELQFPGHVPAKVDGIGDELHIDRFENIGELTNQLIQQTWAPAAVLVNADGDILYISGRTGKYLEPAVGKTNINILAMARDGLREALTGVIRKALNEPQAILLKGIASAPMAAPSSSM